MGGAPDRNTQPALPCTPATAKAARCPWSHCWCSSNILIFVSIFLLCTRRGCHAFHHLCQLEPQASARTLATASQAIGSQCSRSCWFRPCLKVTPQLLNFLSLVHSSCVGNGITSIKIDNTHTHTHTLQFYFSNFSNRLHRKHFLGCTRRWGAGMSHSAVCRHLCAPRSGLQWAHPHREQRGATLCISISFHYPEHTASDSEKGRQS